MAGIFEQGLSGLFGFGSGIRARRQQKSALRQLTPAYGAYGDYLQNAQGPAGYTAPQFQQQQAQGYTPQQAQAALADPTNVDSMINAGYASAYGNLDRALSAAGASGSRGGIRVGGNLRNVQDVFSPVAAQLESQRAQMGQQTALFNAGQQQGVNLANAGWGNQAAQFGAGAQNAANAYNAQGQNVFNLENAQRGYTSGLNAYDIERQRQQAMLQNAQGLYGARIGDTQMMTNTMNQIGTGFGRLGDAAMQGALMFSNPDGVMAGAQNAYYPPVR